MKNSKAIGELSEGMILARLLQLGFAVSIPFGNNQRYDMIVDENGVLRRAQCKTGRIKKGGVRFKPCSTNGFTGKHREYFDDIDLFPVYCPENGNVYRVPVDTIRKCTRICVLRIDPPGNNQSKHVRLCFDAAARKPCPCRS